MSLTSQNPGFASPDDPGHPAGQAAGTTGMTRDVRVTRSRRPTWWAAIAALVAVAFLAYAPYVVFSGTTNLLVSFFILLIMASMWNLLAGYAGLVSVGQQAFVGLGAYFVLILASHHTNPFLAIPVATLLCAAVGLPIWWMVSRLRSGYFSITMWVIATICELIIIQIASLGGGTGTALPGLTSNPTLLTAYTYWAALAVTVVAIGGLYYLLRSPLGLVLTAIRDDETGARSIGAGVFRTQRLVFMVSAAGCGAAGAIYIISQQFVVPGAAFSVQWSAEMIFITIIGGIGTIEGPILGTIVFFVLQQTLSQYGTWYFIVLGLIAMAVAIWEPRGLWGLISDKLGIRLFPVGYYLWPAGEPPRTLFSLRKRA
ncbi:MAG TPA: branched-chain amino acid ABC transporter permease [Streptosporangiaceae bacterium]|nr:branched-chain amino acid ABC transporter permease [Streptosporangiaceae bacterium]